MSVPQRSGWRVVRRSALLLALALPAFPSRADEGVQGGRGAGPFRPRNLVRGLENVVLAGCGTTPGVGIPPVLISGRLAAQRITGAAHRQGPRAHRVPTGG